ncbi:MAG: hypothetical protein M1818_002286 [Claussenomyces sp. TS43310]|nr:MAG: hypothetical protein M1818_002286 [Claussenomyces sp. TS43310]
MSPDSEKLSDTSDRMSSDHIRSSNNEEFLHVGLMPSPTESKGTTPLSSQKEAVFVATLVFARPLTQAGFGQSLAPLHIIGDHFSVTNNGEVSWYLASYPLTTGTLIPVAGRLGDMFGNKRMFIGGYTWFGIWSIITGASYYVSADKVFVFRRAMQGKRKNMVFSLFGYFAPTGYILGAVFSSILAKFANWAWAYFIMGFVSICMALAAISTIPNRQKSATIPEKQTFNWFRFSTGVSGLVLFNIAWNQGAAIGLVLAAMAAGWASFSVWLFYIWQYLEIARGLSPIIVSAQNSPSAICGFVASVAVGLMTGKVGEPWIMVMAMCAFCLSSILVATMTVGQTYWGETFISTLRIPWGMDMSFPAATIMLSMSVPKEHQGIAASMVLTTTNYAISIGLGIAGTVVSNLDPKGNDMVGDCKHGWYVGPKLSKDVLLE